MKNLGKQPLFCYLKKSLVLANTNNVKLPCQIQNALLVILSAFFIVRRNLRAFILGKSFLQTFCVVNTRYPNGNFSVFLSLLCITYALLIHSAYLNVN
jgi:hypothetical protein